MINLEWQPDVTDDLQHAINGGADVRIPYDRRPYVVNRKIRLGRGQTLYLDHSVLEAQKGAFLDAGSYDNPNPLLSAVGLVGHASRPTRVLGSPGATLRMRRDDYTKAPYPKGEFRHGLFVAGCEHFEAEGFAIDHTGGDGLYVTSTPDPSAPGGRRPSSHVNATEVSATACFRNGFCVASVEYCTLRRCQAERTNGTAPKAGFLIEPNGESDWLHQVRLIDCEGAANDGAALMIQLNKLWHKSRPVSVDIEGFWAYGINSHQPAVRCLMGRDRNAPGYVAFDRLLCRDYAPPGLQLDWSMACDTYLEFNDCVWDRCGTGPQQSPFLFNLTNAGNPSGKKPIRFGGQDAATSRPCRIFGLTDRPWCQVYGMGPFEDVLGNVVLMDGTVAPDVAALPNVAVDRI